MSEKTEEELKKIAKAEVSAELLDIFTGGGDFTAFPPAAPSKSSSAKRGPLSPPPGKVEKKKRVKMIPTKGSFGPKTAPLLIQPISQVDPPPPIPPLNSNLVITPLLEGVLDSSSVVPESSSGMKVVPLIREPERMVVVENATLAETSEGVREPAGQEKPTDEPAVENQVVKKPADRGKMIAASLVELAPASKQITILLEDLLQRTSEEAMKDKELEKQAKKIADLEKKLSDSLACVTALDISLKVSNESLAVANSKIKSLEISLQKAEREREEIEERVNVAWWEDLKRVGEDRCRGSGKKPA